LYGEGSPRPPKSGQGCNCGASPSRGRKKKNRALGGVRRAIKCGLIEESSHRGIRARRLSGKEASGEEKGEPCRGNAPNGVFSHVERRVVQWEGCASKVLKKKAKKRGGVPGS